jgi:tetratricopeptide (TPR) repeat protein
MSQDTNTELQAKLEEFRRLYVNAETGIVRADPTDDGKLSIWVSDWSAMEKVPQPASHYKGTILVWGFHVPDGVALAPGYQVQGPAPLARRNHSDSCKCTNCTEANEALAKAAQLSKENKNALAIRRLGFAIKMLEKLRPLGETLAQAYLDMAFLALFSRARHKAQRKQNGLDAAAWYEKAIKVWEENGNNDLLRSNLTNLGSLYFRIGDYETSLVRNLRGLKMEKAKNKNELDEDSYNPFNHVAGCYLALGRLDEAEATVRESFALLGDNTPSSGYLWNTLSSITQARAEQYRKRAEELVPPDSCSIG